MEKLQDLRLRDIILIQRGHDPQSGNVLTKAAVSFHAGGADTMQPFKDAENQDLLDAREEELRDVIIDMVYGELKAPVGKMMRMLDDKELTEEEQVIFGGLEADIIKVFGRGSLVPQEPPKLVESE